MQPKRVNIYDAKAQLSKLIAGTEKDGQTVIICRNGRPVAQLIPYREISDPLEQDPRLAGAVYYVDPCAPVPEDDWPEALR